MKHAFYCSQNCFREKKCYYFTMRQLLVKGHDKCIFPQTFFFMYLWNLQFSPVTAVMFTYVMICVRQSCLNNTLTIDLANVTWPKYGNGCICVYYGMSNIISFKELWLTSFRDMQTGTEHVWSCDYFLQPCKKSLQSAF